MGEAVDFGVVHGKEELAGLDGWGQVGAGLHFATARTKGDNLVVQNAQPFRVTRMDFDVGFRGVELLEDVGLGRSRLGVPLAAGAASGKEYERVVGVWGFGEFIRF